MFVQQLQNPGFTIASLLITGSSSMLIMFFYCYFGKLATLNFEKMTDVVFEMNWLDLPVELQKYFILMIANMQKPLYYYGGGIVILDLSTFVNVRVTMHFALLVQIKMKCFIFSAIQTSNYFLPDVQNSHSIKIQNKFNKKITKAWEKVGTALKKY